VLGAAFVFCHLAFVFLTCYIYISVWMCFVTELLITRDGLQIFFMNHFAS